MGKKSLTKSTTKKKSPSPKKSASKQAEASATPPKTGEKKPVKAQKPAASPPKTAKKILTVGELLRLTFDTWAPAEPYAPPTDLTTAATYTAPPFFEAKTPEENQAIKALLARQFDLAAPPEAPTPKAPATPKAEEIPQQQETPPVDQPPPAPEAPAAEERISAPEPEPAPAIEPEAPPAPPAAEAEAPTPEPGKSPEPVATVEKPDAAIPETPAAPEPYIPTGPACAEPPDDKEPPNNALRMLIGCLAVIFGLLMIASSLNTNNYYLKSTDAGLEIWRGKFSPKGKTLVETVPNMVLSTPAKSSYNRAQAMTLVYDYYMNQAALRSTVIGEPDFAAVTGLYEQAKKYAPTTAQATAADTRLRTIKAQALLSEADAAVVKMTPKNIEKALALLHEAAGKASDRTQQQLIRVKIDELTAIKAEMDEKKNQDKTRHR